MDGIGGGSPRQYAGHDVSVEFVYRPALADIEGALRARAFRTPAGRAQQLLAPVLAAVAAVVFGALRGAPVLVWIISAVLSAAIGCWAVRWGLRTMSRRMFSILEPYGECRTVADERGAVTTAERASFSFEWTVHREYLETPGLFVLLGGDQASSVGVLPKRGAQGPEDVDRVREILDRHLRRR
ncbi:hypothetical protein [Streptomyces sp. NPDC127084]|uniref:hypothetical protein n=1 Tax=Streptomyces sp. NPDC127084 TaxID=3347133 RepID=UPI00364C0DE2